MEHYFTNNSSLKSEIRTLKYENKGIIFTFSSDLGVFAKNHLDYGSKVLVETVLKNEKRTNLSILDVGCGYGFIGIVLGKCLHSPVTLTDVNKRAVHLSNMNLKENDVLGTSLVSDCYENINDKYDLIVTNPPIRAGKEVVLRILLNAKNHLKNDGILWFVIRKDQGAKSIIRDISSTYKCEIVEKSKGFYVILAKMC